MAKLKIALYGGTFDPVHHGHLIGAQDVLDQLRLDLILFIPAALSPHKLNTRPTPAKQRLAMLKRATAWQERFLVSSCEIDRPAPSYAIDTAEQIAAEYPGARLHWMLGADQLEHLHTWERISDLKKRVTFIVLDRTVEKRRTLPGLLHLPKPRRIDISSTEIRERVRRGLPLEHLVPAAVARYIHSFHLYSK